MRKKSNIPAEGAQAPRLKKKELQERVLKFLEKESKQAFNYKQIAFAIDAMHPANRMDIITLLDELTAADLIQEVALAMARALSVDAIADTIHGHPTLGEAVQQAARML